MRHVYLLQRVREPNQRYVGITSDVERRLAEHNQGKSPHTSKHLPWEVVVSIAFADEARAAAFEQYLKSGSGIAFARRHFW